MCELVIKLQSLLHNRFDLNNFDAILPIEGGTRTISPGPVVLKGARWAATIFCRFFIQQFPTIPGPRFSLCAPYLTEIPFTHSFIRVWKYCDICNIHKYKYCNICSPHTLLHQVPCTSNRCVFSKAVKLNIVNGTAAKRKALPRLNDKLWQFAFVVIYYYVADATVAMRRCCGRCQHWRPIWLDFVAIATTEGTNAVVVAVNFVVVVAGIVCFGWCGTIGNAEKWKKILKKFKKNWK